MKKNKKLKNFLNFFEISLNFEIVEEKRKCKNRNRINKKKIEYLRSFQKQTEFFGMKENSIE